MTIKDQIRDEKLQYDINREAAKISDLSSGKIDKYEYLTGEEILLKPKDLKSKEIKPIKAKPGETKPSEYSDYFLNKLAIIRRSFEPVNFYDLTYNFKDSRIHQ